jgi:3-phenylpropionate/trans-cinnamate dioxygenase ferredoxin reductase subunit
MLSAEPHRPYDRPPLSKEVLTGRRDAAELAYRPADWYAEHGIDLLAPVRAVSLSLSERRVAISSGGRLRYDKLLIATGSSPRALPELGPGERVSVLRTVDDAVRLRDVLRERPRLAVVGAGFIGQEVAATARSLGAEVTMIEAAPCPLHGVLGLRVGEWFAELHRTEGVRVLTDTRVAAVRRGRRNLRLTLSTGARVNADHVVVGVGVQPDVDWLRGSGLDTRGGVRADEHGHTGKADVFAAGDVAATFEPRIGRHVLGSHWEAAARQGARAARAMLGQDPGTSAITSFWSDQHGLRIQYVGHAARADAVAFDGEPCARNFSAVFTAGGRAVAALIVDRPRALPAARQLVETGEQV